MTKKSPVSLLDQIRTLPPTKSDSNCWWDGLKQRSPEVYEQVCEVVRDFNRGGDAFAVFKHASKLCRYLQGRDPVRPGANLLGSVTEQSFRVFVTHLKNQR
jgi:hypothetical protein